MSPSPEPMSVVAILGMPTRLAGFPFQWGAAPAAKPYDCHVNSIALYPPPHNRGSVFRYNWIVTKRFLLPTSEDPKRVIYFSMPFTDLPASHFAQCSCGQKLVLKVVPAEKSEWGVPLVVQRCESCGGIESVVCVEELVFGESLDD